MTNTLPLAEQWRWSGSVHDIAFSEGRIVIVTYKEGVGQKIIVFDVHTGKLLWENEDIKGLRSVATDEKRVYVGTITSVQAYDLETGQKLWQGVEQPSMKRGGFVVYVKENQVEGYDIFEPIVYILDVATGQVVDKISKSLFFRWDGIDYSIIRGNYFLEARDTKSNEKLWSHEFSGYIGGRPAFAEDIMLLTARGQIFGIKTRTGQIIWKTTDIQPTFTHPEYITPVAVQGNLAYALRYDAAVVGFNPKTGKQVGTIEMKPNHTMEDDEGYTKYYGIATSDRFVAVYYGNSEELLVFEKLNFKE